VDVSLIFNSAFGISHSAFEWGNFFMDDHFLFHSNPLELLTEKFSQRVWKHWALSLELSALGFCEWPTFLWMTLNPLTEFYNFMDAPLNLSTLLNVETLLFFC
jgi:hypothetical protein